MLPKQNQSYKLIKAKKYHVVDDLRFNQRLCSYENQNKKKISNSYRLFYWNVLKTECAVLSWHEKYNNDWLSLVKSGDNNHRLTYSDRVGLTQVRKSDGAHDQYPCFIVF